MGMGQHVAIKKGMDTPAPQPLDGPEMNAGVSSYASTMNSGDASTDRCRSSWCR